MPSQVLSRPKSAQGASLLAGHLLEVKGIIGRELPNNTELQSVGEIAGAVHDWGKCTDYFQSYLRDPKDAQYTNKEENMQRHSLVGAYATMYVVDNAGYSESLAIAAFLSVARHHGVLKNVDSDRTFYSDTSDRDCLKGIKRVIDKVENVIATRECVGDALLSNAAPTTDVTTQGLLEYIQSQKPLELLNLKSPISETPTYTSSLQLYSTLTFADKLSAAGLPTNPSTEQLTVTEIESHIQDLDPSTEGILGSVNKIREESRREAIEGIKRSSETGGVYTLTLPTGFGKTFTGLSAALTRANTRDGRVIYALPFTSIIDQVDEEIQNVFGVSPPDPEYTVHHHLRETRSIDGDTELDRDTQQLLGETWQAQCVLTTFVQLFESLAGPQNRESLKLPSLRNSTIILDEPQSLPPKWWAFVARITTVLTEEYNADVVMMTATQPKILENMPFGNSSPTELVPDGRDEAFELLSDRPRVAFNLDESVVAGDTTETHQVPHSVAADRLAADTADSVLSICNTIDSATTLSTELTNRLSKNTLSLNAVLDDIRGMVGSSQARLEQSINALIEELTTRFESCEALVCTLSTNIRPIDRKLLLGTIRELLDMDACPQLYVVSTQLIEAGVDVSFDGLYRDVAPVASVVQAAGRCNRAFEGTQSEVTVWQLAAPGENSGVPSTAIYTDGQNVLRPAFDTFEVLVEQYGSCVPENAFIDDGIREYYNRLYDSKEVGSVGELVEFVEEGAFESLRSQSMIGTEYEMVDVFVAVTNAEKELYEQYCRCQAHFEFKKCRELLSVMSPRMCSLAVTDEVLSKASVCQFPDREDVLFLDATKKTGYTDQYTLEKAHGVQPSTVSDQLFF